MTGYIVFGHGSSVESANEAVRVMARRMASQGNLSHVQAAFLEGGRPDLNGAVAALASEGVARIVILPYFLTLGLHLQRDLPKLAEAARASHPEIKIAIAPPLDGHPGVVEALLGRALDANVVPAREVCASPID